MHRRIHEREKILEISYYSRVIPALLQTINDYAYAIIDIWYGEKKQK